MNTERQILDVLRSIHKEISELNQRVGRLEEVAATKEDSQLTEGALINKKDSPDKIMKELGEEHLKYAETVRSFESRIFILESKVAELTLDVKFLKAEAQS